MDYSVVIPVYNESQNIRQLSERILTVMDSLSGDYEVIYVDDGSTDATYDMLSTIAFSNPRICVISFRRNYGQHPAVVAGLEQAHGRLVITLDADLQNPPEEIPRLLETMKAGFDMVCGRRQQRRDSFLRRAGSLLVNLYFTFLSGVYLKDNGTMLRVLTQRTAKEFARRYHGERLYIPLLILKITKNITEVGVQHADRLSGESRYNLKKLIVILWVLTVRYHPAFYRFLQRVGFARRDGELYSLKKKIVQSREVAIA